MKILKPTGAYLIQKSRKYLVLWILCLFSFIAISLTLIRVSPLYVDLGPYDTVRVLILVFPGIGALLFYRLHRSYQLGYAGEEHVTRTLSAALSDDYLLINDAHLAAGKGGNIDHIVIGPTGIFVLETKNYSGKIACYGDNWKGIHNSPSVQVRINASRTYEVIEGSKIFTSRSPWVQAVLVFPNRNVLLDIRRPPPKVEVLKINELTDYIIHEPNRLSAQEVELVSKTILDVHASH